MSLVPFFYQRVPTSVTTATATATATSTGQHVGWFEEWDVKPRRYIRVEQLQKILKAQGNSWASELEDTYAEGEKRLATTTSEQHKKALKVALTEVAHSVQQPFVDWEAIRLDLQVAVQARHSIEAMQHAERVTAAIREWWEREYDDEEALLLLING